MFYELKTTTNMDQKRAADIAITFIHTHARLIIILLILSNYHSKNTIIQNHFCLFSYSIWVYKELVSPLLHTNIPDVIRNSFKHSTQMTKLERSINVYKTIRESSPNIVKEVVTLEPFYKIF